jgi:hypothetical protein
MAKNNQTKNRKLRKDRRGVGAIMGGVILIAILLTSMLLYFITILDNDQRRASYDIQSAQINQEKAAEALKASRDRNLFTNGTGTYINTVIINDGSIPIVLDVAALHCTDCPSPNDLTVVDRSITLNAKEVVSQLVGPVTDGTSYRVDLITERGNIVSTEECAVDIGSGICTNDPSGGPADFDISASPISVVLEAGNSGSSVITVTSLNGFSDPVLLSASTPVAGIGHSFGTNTVIPPAGSSNSTTLTITSSPTTNPGTYTMVVTGNSGALNHTAGISITILEEIACIECAVTEGIIQGTGSVQLDFKAFGAIYPTLQDRDSVSQKGWRITANDALPPAPGYPGFSLKQDLKTVLVERMRNFDPSGNNMVLDKSTQLVVQLGGTPGNNPTANHICTRSGDDVVPYSNTQVLPYTTPTADQDAGMQLVYFCSKTQVGDESGSNGWTPTNTFGNVNPIFMILRSTFQNTNVDYGQTVPYQSFIMSHPMVSWYVCLTSSDLAIQNSNNCENPELNSTKSIYKYRGNPGDVVFVHFNTATAGSAGPGTSPYKLEWIYPDGTSTSLTHTTTANGNLRITIPTKMADETTDIVRSTPSTDALYILKVSDSFTSDQGPHTMFLTFKVT